MNQPIRTADEIAHRVLICETATGDPPQSLAVSHAVEKLRLYLTRFVGSAGFHALLARALALAKAEIPCLASVRVTDDGTLAGLDDAVQNRNRDEAKAAQVALVAQLLGLLITFIGENVTLHIVRDVWSDMYLDDLTVSSKEQTR